VPDKVAVITDGDSGIGRAIALKKKDIHWLRRNPVLVV
jgi:hypothetical protein